MDVTDIQRVCPVCNSTGLTNNERVAARPPSLSQHADPAGLSYRGLSPVPDRFSAIILFAELVRSGPSPILDDAFPGTGGLASGRHGCLLLFRFSSHLQFAPSSKGASAAVTQHDIPSRALIDLMMRIKPAGRLTNHYLFPRQTQPERCPARRVRCRLLFFPACSRPPLARERGTFAGD